MPIVKVEMYAGRTKEQKAELAKAITDAVVNIARTTADETIVIFTDVERGELGQGAERWHRSAEEALTGARPA